MAGRTAFFGGRWNGSPCSEWARHIVQTDAPLVINGQALTAIRLCDAHFEQVNVAGLISVPWVAHKGRDDSDWTFGPPPGEGR